MYLGMLGLDDGVSGGGWDGNGMDRGGEGVFRWGLWVCGLGGRRLLGWG